jgi:DNA primase
MNKFNKVKDKLDLYKIASRYTALKKEGIYFKGICPFERTLKTDFTLCPPRQIFYCFGCHASGDAISLTAKAENISQIDACNLLIKRYGLTDCEDDQ